MDWGRLNKIIQNVEDAGDYSIATYFVVSHWYASIWADGRPPPSDEIERRLTAQEAVELGRTLHWSQQPRPGETTKRFMTEESATLAAAAWIGLFRLLGKPER